MVNNINDLYPKYHKLVIGTCRGFLKSFKNEELEDLTQSAWECIIKKYKTYKKEDSKLSTWIVIVTKSAMYDMLKANNTDKRKTDKNSISLDSLTNGRDKYL